MSSAVDNIVNAQQQEEAMSIIIEIPAYLGGRRRAKTDRQRAADAGADATFWGRQCLGNINLGLEVEAVRKAATAAAHHYRRREELLGRGEEEATVMVHANPFDPKAAKAARRSWEEATPAEQEEMLKPEREAYGRERAIRGIIAAYIANIRESLEGRAVAPASLTATAAVVRVAGELGAIMCATSSGRPRVFTDGNAVAYYELEVSSPDDVVAHTDPTIDPLLEELAAALGCAWRWVGDEAIELVEASS